MKKFILTSNQKEHKGRTLYQIQALRSFSDVKEGELGGWIEREENLSHEGDCWVYDDGKVYDYAKVFGNAKVCHKAEVFVFAKVYENARVLDCVEIKGFAEVCGNAMVRNRARVCDRAKVYDFATIFKGTVREQATVCEYAVITDLAQIYGNAIVRGGARIAEYAEVFGEANISGNAIIETTGRISSNKDFIVIENLCPKDELLVAYKTSSFENSNYIGIICGTDVSFSGSLNDFSKYIKESYKDSVCLKKYEAAIELICFCLTTIE